MSLRLRRRTAGTLACTLAAWALASLVQAQSLTDALVQAYKSNPKLLSERAQLKVTDEGVPQAIANWRPTISAQASDSYVQDRINGASDITAQSYLRNQYPGDSYGLSVTQNIYRGGRTVGQTRQAKAMIGQEKAKVLSVEQTVLLQVVTDYVDLARDQTIADVAFTRLNNAQAELAGVTAKRTAGEATRLDVAAAEGAVDDAGVAHQQAISQRRVSLLAFQRDTGMSAGSITFPLGLTELPTSADQVVSLASEASFDVEMARYAVKAAEAAVKVARGQGLPTISFQGTLLHQDGVTFPGESEDVEAATVQLKVPIYNGGLLASELRSTRRTVEARRDDLEEARRQAAAAAGDAWTQFDYAGRSETMVKAKAASLATTLEGVRRQQGAGERTLSDMIAAEQALFAAQIAAVQSHHDYLISQYSLANSVGQLTARKLDLPVDFYDPDKYLRSIGWGPGR